MAHQHFQQVEFRARQLQVRAGPGNASLFRPHRQLPHGQWREARRIVRRRLRAAQNGADAGRQLARRAWFCHVIVGAQLQAHDAVRIVAARRQHQDGQVAAGADAAQRFQAIHAWHHDVEDGDRVQARQRFGCTAFAVMHGAGIETFLRQVFLEHADQFHVVID
ncbi:hypothetical protein D3C72_1790780 [compost metagenome]